MNKNERRVQFHPKCTVLEISTLDEYTDEEILKCWYTKHEFKQIATRSQKQAARWESGESSMPDSFHRGLEIFTEEGEEIITSCIQRCIDAVMDEQAVQWENEVDDYDRLAAVSAKVSRVSAVYALDLAMEDEQEAQRMYIRMEKKNKKTKKVKHSSLTKPVEEEGDDHTSMCSDLSLPGLEWPSSRESPSFETMENSLDLEQVDQGTDAILPRRVKALTMHNSPCRPRKVY
ncbi:unnamed protein product [Cylindrotheca closterium]|uniref:Uncharacterized protein n=1 Tax=Cylindrotheca closterium TaxID=2856 RepID=A0AAD2FPY9_9STRA|nr:unnamed protein product [Cylindrotheca closterium]